MLVLGEDVGHLVQDARRGPFGVEQVEVSDRVGGAVRFDAQRDSGGTPQALHALFRRQGHGGRGAREGSAGGAEDVAGRGSQVGEGAVEQGVQVRVGFQEGAEFPAYVLGQRVVVGGATAEVAPLSEVDRLGDGPEAGVRGYGDERDAACSAGVGEDVGDGAVRLLAGEEGRDPGRLKRRDEPVRLLGAVGGVPPDQAAEDDLAPLEKARGVLQVGGGDPADLPGQEPAVAPHQSEVESVELEEIFDVHGLAPCAADELHPSSHIHEANTSRVIVNAR